MFNYYVLKHLDFPFFLIEIYFSLKKKTINDNFIIDINCRFPADSAQNVCD